MIKLTNFHQTGDCLGSLNLGIKPLIIEWLEEMKVERYYINEDLTIDILGDLNLTNKNLNNLPNFIKFNIVYGGFYGAGNNWTSLVGMPNEICGDFGLRESYLSETEGKPFIEEEVRNRIKINGKLWL